MRFLLLLFSFFFASFFNVLMAAPPGFIQTKDGVIVYTNPAFTGTVNAVKLEVVTDKIIRVLVAPAKEILPVESLVTVYSKRNDLA